MVPSDVEGRSGKGLWPKPDVYAAGKADVGNSTDDCVEQSRGLGGGDVGGKAQ